MKQEDEEETGILTSFVLLFFFNNLAFFEFDAKPDTTVINVK